MKNRYLCFAIQMLLGILAGIALVTSGSFVSYPFAGLFGIVISSLFGVLFHEIGHLLVGLLVGYQFRFFQLFSFRWIKENGKIRLKRLRVSGASGACAMIQPPDISAVRYCFYMLGGIGANLICGAVAIGLLFLVPGDSRLYSFLLAFAVSQITLGVANLLPLFSQNNPLDGMIFWNLLFRTAYGNSTLERDRLSALLAAGTRPRDLPVSQSFDGQNIGLSDMPMLYFAYLKSLDGGDYQMTGKYLYLIEQNLHLAPSVMLPGLYNELCYFGCITSDIHRADYYYQKNWNSLKQDDDINGLRVKSAFAYYVRHNSAESAMLCQKALETADDFMIKGQAVMEKQLIEELYVLTQKQ